VPERFSTTTEKADMNGISVACYILATSLGASADSSPITLGRTRELFLDDHLIASTENVTRKLQVAQKYPGNPVLGPKEEWEGPVALTHGSVIRDGDIYRIWYHSRPGVSYAESPDGIAWTKPKLGLFEIDGHDTNVVIDRDASPRKPNALPYFGEVIGVLKDTHEKDPSRRYKMGFLSIERDYKGPHEDLFHHGQRRGLGVAVSPDGIHWSLIDNWTTETICDGPGHWMWDPRIEKYVLYGRTKYVAPDVQQRWANDDWCSKNCWGRSVTRIESPDLITWNMTERGVGPVIMTADAEDPVGTEMYSMHVFPYESVYVGLVQVFHNQPDQCVLDVQLTTSRDGVSFSRVGNRETFIPLGPVGSWDRFNNSLANNAPIAVGDELRFYYSGRTYRHGPYDGPDKGQSGGRIGFATVRRDRFVALQASFDGGRIATKPVKLEGPTLHINAKADYGEILIEALDAQGEVVAQSVPVRADTLDIPVKWKGDKGPNPDDPVQLRITLRNALLFSIWSE
jgi:hypothetical protein